VEGVARWLEELEEEEEQGGHLIVGIGRISNDEYLGGKSEDGSTKPEHGKATDGKGGSMEEQNAIQERHLSHWIYDDVRFSGVRLEAGLERESVTFVAKGCAAGDCSVPCGRRQTQ
jgi:hypothetical protein